MAIKYKFNSWNNTATKVVIKKETDNYVYIDGQRQAKRTNCNGFIHDGYFDSIEELKHTMVISYEQRITLAKNQIDYFQKQIDKINAITEHDTENKK